MIVMARLPSAARPWMKRLIFYLKILSKILRNNFIISFSTKSNLTVIITFTIAKLILSLLPTQYVQKFPHTRY